MISNAVSIFLYWNMVVSMSSTLYAVCLCCPCFPWCVDVCLLSSACLRSLFACLLCWHCQNSLRPPALDTPLPPSLSGAPISHTALQGSVWERPQTSLPHPTRALASLDQWTMAVEGPVGVEVVIGDGDSVAGLSCSTVTPSEGTDMRQLLRTPGRHHWAPCSSCSSLVARLRKMDLRSWYDLFIFISSLILFWGGEVLLIKKTHQLKNLYHSYTALNAFLMEYCQE